MKHRIIAYRSSLRQRARDLRAHLTLAEVLLWNCIKRRQIEGCDFDRQRPLGAYIVDFYCKELRLAIEVDGSSHDYKGEYDIRRRLDLESLGIHIVRYADREIRKNTDSVVAHLREAIRKRRAEIA